MLGLALSPYGSTLYVDDTQGSYVMAYNVNKDGTLSEARKFCEPKQPKGTNASGADGMAIDRNGNLYVATKPGVQVFGPTGAYLTTIPVPSPANNVSFGGPADQILFISATDGIYAIQTTQHGL